MQTPPLNSPLQLLKEAPVGIILFGPDGTIVDFNSEAARIFGYTPEEFAKIPLDDLIPDRVRGHHRDLVAAFVAAPKSRRMGIGMEVNGKRKDGTHCTLEIGLNPITSEGRHYVCAAISDITLRVDAERRVKFAEHTLHSTVDGVVAAGAHDARIAYANQGACELCACTQEEIRSRSLWELAGIDTRSGWEGFVGRLAAAGRLQFESTVRRKDGVLVPVEVSARLGEREGRRWVIANLHDLSVRKAIENELRESKQSMALAFEGAMLGHWDWHIPTGHVIFNERWTEMLGYRADEIKPHVDSWGALLHPEDAPAVMKDLNDHLEGRAPHYRTIHRLKHKDGHWVWVLDAGRVLERDAKGNAVRAVGIHLDMTAQRDAEQALEKSYKELSRLESLRDDLVHMVAHDLRTPLSVIRMQLEVLGMELPGQATGGIARAIQATDYLHRLIADMLDLSRLEAKKLPINSQVVRVKDLAESALKIIPAPSALRVRLPELSSEQKLWGDQQLLVRVVANLLNNAIKFSKPADPVEISCERVNGSVRVNVKDRGPGIPEADRQAIFDKFSQAEAGRKGGSSSFGVGLAFCKLAVEAHGGRIGVDSEVGKGSTFWFEIPAEASAGHSAN